MDTKFRVTVERWHDDERIAVVTADNPPVNAMSIGFPQAIYEAINQAGADPGIELILLTAAGKGMFAGADIKTQGKPWPKGELSLFELIALIDENPKPVAILARVIALGGGLELALACKYRIAEAGTMLGQTEVKLGIPPGAGGTQRLPRLVGVEKALDMVLYGEPIDANEALACGLIDRVVSKSGPVGEAVNYLKAQLDTGKMPLRARDRQVSKHDPSLFASTRQRVGKRSRGETAPLVCIDSVEAATTMSFDDGIAYERARFLECVVSEQAAALRHVFSAERQARKVPGIGKDDTGRPIERAAVLGAGTMGAGIAMCFADAGIPVTVIEREQDALDRGLARVADTYAGQAKKGRIDEAAAATRTALVAGALGLDAAAASDVVVEAVFEDMDMKKAVFSELSKIAKPDAVLATNTSYLDVNEIAAATNGRDANVLGLHFFSPANIMKLLEVVRGAKTAGDVVVTGLKLGRRLGKTAIVSGVGHGFIGNRMFAQYNREAEFMLQEGATVDQVDAALYEFGMALGSFSVRDLAGLDIGWAMRKSTAHLRKPEERYSTVCDEICERGWFGQKSGKGFYVYDGGSKTMNPEVQAIVDQTGKVAGIEPNRITDDQIIERCVYALVNEGAKILEDGIALRASDIDLVFINGYGFPRWRGGPMHYADTVGLEAILETVCTFNTSHDFWTPAPLMERLVKDGRTFADWDKESAHCPKKGSEPLNQV